MDDEQNTINKKFTGSGQGEAGTVPSGFGFAITVHVLAPSQYDAGISLRIMEQSRVGGHLRHSQLNMSLHAGFSMIYISVELTSLDLGYHSPHSTFWRCWRACWCAFSLFNEQVSLTLKSRILKFALVRARYWFSKVVWKALSYFVALLSGRCQLLILPSGLER